MVWIVLGCIGVPIWLLLGAIAALLWNRNHFKKQPGVFAAKLGLESGSFSSLSDKPASCYCVWVHDVLLVHKGLGLISTHPVPVTSAEEPKHLGDKILYLRFLLDDGSILKMSGFGEDLTLALGPFQINEAEESQPTGEPSYIDELERLAKLKDEGIITEEDFEAKKKQLLGLQLMSSWNDVDLGG